MTGKGEYYVRCKNCGSLIKVCTDNQVQAYCNKCEKVFDFDTNDIVFAGITTIPSDYHYKWKEEKNLEEKLTKYKRAFKILKDELNIELGKEEHTFKDFKDIYYYMSIKPAWQDTKTTFELSQKEHELLEELMKGEKN